MHLWICIHGITNKSVLNLHSKHFRGVGEQRKTKERYFGGERDGRKRLQTNPWILKTSIRQWMGLVSGWTSQTLKCVDHRIKKGKVLYKNLSPNEALVVSFDSTVEIL